MKGEPQNASVLMPCFLRHYVPLRILENASVSTSYISPLFRSGSVCDL